MPKTIVETGVERGVECRMMRTEDQILISNGTELPAKATSLPQRFFLKIRRGTRYTYVTDAGESDLQSDAKDFADHRAVHVESQVRLRQKDVDGTEVEMVSV